MSNRTAWEDAWERALPRISSLRDTLSRNPIVSRVTRVGKLDSELLDQELVQLLEEPLKKAFSLLNTNLRAQFQPELTLLIQLTLYKLSIWNQGASYGARLQDLRYSAPKATGSRARNVPASGLPRRLLLLHGVITLLLPYVHGKLRTYALSKAWPDAPSSDRRRKAWELLSSLESSYAALSLGNFVAFLWDGRYRTIADRLCKLELMPSSRVTQRNVSYEFMNRQMVWHAFTEFLLFFLPLVNARALRRRLSRTVTSVVDVFTSTTGSRSGIARRQRRGKYWSLPQDQCAICAENAAYNFNLSDDSNALTALTAAPSTATGPPAPDSGLDDDAPPQFPINVPYAASCGDVYCYHCLAERLMRVTDEGSAAQGWDCLRCGEAVRTGERYVAPVEDVSSGDSLSEYEFTSDMDATDLSGSLASGGYSDDPSSPGDN
ncbi:Pex12 amino terminal region-domain-containing protein [Schizophyllum amplum]|uniref:RING-type E3 ubiquitin transferase (cysteine targeting) n=1 Tax=Schizophyllum amplum TaxID=97359 RepID=A0A550CS99_9AGAR|nr:Pex12 amino terminal region-domain-containing protein [Auriculariopsis ampla]